MHDLHAYIELRYSPAKQLLTHLSKNRKPLNFAQLFWYWMANKNIGKKCKIK